MEAFNLVEKLESHAISKGWLFFNGDEFYANVDADGKADIGQLALWINLNIDSSRGKGNRLSKINYTGLIALGGKFDDNYTIENNNNTNANLDESFDQKYKRRLSTLLKTLSDELGIVSCANNLQIITENYIYDINKFDTNFDFVVGQFNIEQETFKP